LTCDEQHWRWRRSGEHRGRLEVHGMTKVLVAYASRLGGTRGIAEAIEKGLESRGHEAIVKSVADVSTVEPFDAIVLGSGVFANHWHKPAVVFARRYEAELTALPLWLFSSGPVGDIKNPGPLADPKEVAELRSRLRPRDHQIFWGSLDRKTLDQSDLGTISRFISRRFIPEGDWRDWPAIDAWAETISNELRVGAAIVT
jgi:menaquinone-dependent protoporphyrinogen oxidase